MSQDQEYLRDELKLIARRKLLRRFGVAGAAAVAAPLGFLGFSTRPTDDICRTNASARSIFDVFGSSAYAADAPPVATTPPKAIKLAWNATAPCLAPVALALQEGIFTKHNLNVELINFGGSTEQLLEAIATRKADAGVGMALRWLKPLEQGFDVKLTGGTRGGCLRLVSSKASGLTDLAQLRGKTIGVSDMASPAKNFFAIMLAKRGIDPVKDVEWRQFPPDLLKIALQKGEAQAIADGDPRLFLSTKDTNLVEIATNLSGEYKNRACCVIGIRGSLIREDKPTARALTQALLEAQMRTSMQPEAAAKAFAKFAKATPEEVTAMLQSHTHGHNPVGSDFKTELRLYAEELKLVSVLKPSTDPSKFAERVYANVLS
ncbi:ABC transporter substrate-binding protein [Glaciimonas sp. PCH181]|uniref:ABC transporter substrate-binding protein n=1 Tax=Glaciimonas sp. PCH181 TaxID=2133943 RepID=UPI001CED55A7|nr:ABC transporter substrate-binding protein [Glaciimonas sp. PCH181]